MNVQTTPPPQDLESAIRALMEGDAQAAYAGFQGLVAADPSKFELRYWLSSAAAAAGFADEAQTALNDGRLLHAFALIRGMGGDVPRLTKDPKYAQEVADTIYGVQSVATAGVAFSMALSAGSEDVQVLFSYGLCLHHQGRAEEAVMVFRAVCETARTSAAAHQFLLFALFYVENGIERQAEAARLWASLYEQKNPPAPFANSRDPKRKLRIGYVSPSFIQVQARQFVAAVIDHLDRDAFEVFLYPGKAEGETGWAKPVTVRGADHLSDEQFAALIRKDRIDVLIDVWGHNPGNRLPVFGHRAAPVQASWLNYQQTTGLTRMDYSMQTEGVQTPDMDRHFTETVWMVPGSSAPYRPDPGATVAPAPSLTSGQVTFGSFNNPAKLTDQTVAAWARILHGRPGSRLLLKYSYFEDQVMARSTAARFAAHGIGMERLLFAGHTKGKAYEDAFALVDLALDPSPCPGGTTSFEALARGVPVLTLKGETYYSRIGVPIVVGAGMSDLVADSWDDYVAKAIAATETAEGLQTLRDRAAAGFLTAPYRDEAGITRALEAAYRAMFERWCEAG
jgi:predicted O-linked N-acetylglucosamine transferase (SPINDLY family)